MKRFSTLFLLVSLLAFLFGCSRNDSFQKRDGTWEFEGLPLNGVDATRFLPLGDRYARDGDRVIYCSNYREGRDYFTTKRVCVTVVAGAIQASFRVLKSGYARDASALYFEGVRFPVRDGTSFEILDYGFARDRTCGYYLRTEVPGSEGASFGPVDNHYAKDARNVFHAELRPGVDGAPARVTTLRLDGADPVSFKSLEPGYATDAGRAYFRGRVLTRDVAAFRALAFGYAKSATQVFFDGEVMAGADAATFVTLDAPTDRANARDARGEFQQGRRVTDR